MYTALAHFVPVYRNGSCADFHYMDKYELLRDANCAGKPVYWYKVVYFCAIVSIYFLFSLQCGGKSEMTAEQLYQKGLEYFQEDNLKKAHECFIAASEKKDRPVYNWASARTAQTRNEAFIFAWKAWNGGLKTEDILMFLMLTSDIKTEKEKIAYGLKLLSEMADDGDKDLIRGEIYLNNGKTDTAMTIWRDALRIRPSGYLANALGRVYLIRSQYDSLMILLQTSDSSHYLDRQGYSLYAYALAHSARFNESKKILLKAQSEGLDSGQIGLDLVWIDLLSSNFTDAIKNLQAAKRYGMRRDASLSYQLTLLEAFIYRQTLDTEDLIKMKESLCSLSIKTNECHFVESMIKSVQGVQGDTSVLETLEELCKSDPRNPVFDLALINEYLLSGKPRKAVHIFTNLPLYLIRFPSVVLMQAQIEASTGNYKAALEVLNSMHKRGSISKASLELEQNITFMLNMDENCFSLQKMLERSFPDDIDVGIKRALLFLKAAKADSALAVLDKFSPEESSNKLVFAARLHAFFIKREYEKIKSEVLKKAGKDPELLVFKAHAELMQKDTAGAQGTFRLAAKNAKNPFVYLEYAELLAHLEKYDEAANYYSKAIPEVEKYSPNYSKLPIILSKAAWYQLKSGKDLNIALKYSKRAYQINENDIDIIYTYCSVLAETGRSKYAISLLNQHLKFDRRPVLLYCLGRVYKKTEQKKNVQKIYDELRELPDSTLHNNNITRNMIEQLTK